MFGIGPMEFLVIAVIAVIFVGPDKLPDVLKKFGRFYVQAKRHANDVKSGFDEAIHSAERELELERIRELQKQLTLTANSVTDVIDAKHTDHSADLSKVSDDGHTADGRLIATPTPELVHAADASIVPNPALPHSDTADASAMPPGELNDQTAYHEGHLPPQTRADDHDPFAPANLSNPALAPDDKPKDPEKKS